MIKENMEKQLEYCDEAPFYTLGPYRYRSGLRPHYLCHRSRNDWMVRMRNVVLCHPKRTPWPAQKDVKDGVITYKIAAHAADLKVIRVPTVTMH
jgi:phosphomethylpyrimidine synthase